MKVVVIGGGPGGFSAAMVAKRVGAEVTLIERTDALGGLGLVAGIGMLGAAAYVFTEERAMGGAALVDIFEALATHKGVALPGLGTEGLTYNVTRLDAWMQRALQKAGIEFLLRKTVVDAKMSGGRVEGVILQDDTTIAGDAFIDATGATNGTSDCEKLGRGCVHCILRCPAFGSPGGIADKRSTIVSRLDADGKPGTIGTSVLVPLSSMSPSLQKEVTTKGYALVPVPPNAVIDEWRMKKSGSPHLVRQEIHIKNLLIIDVGGHVKVTALGSPMYAGSLRAFPGLEDAWIEQPVAGAVAHLITWTTMAYRDNCLKAEGFDNLFVAGHKSGPQVCLTSTIVTGDLAGYNAVRCGMGQSCLELPKTLMTGAFIDYVGQRMRSEEGLRRGYGLIEPEILKGLGVYREDKTAIAKEVEKAGLKGIYQTKLC